MSEAPEGYYRDGAGRLHRQHDVYGGPHDKPASDGFPLTAAQTEHLNHMTDGRWHDDCPMCLYRREHSATTGIPEYDAYLRSQWPEVAPEATPAVAGQEE